MKTIELIHPYDGSPEMVACDGTPSGVWTLAHDEVNHYEAVIEGKASSWESHLAPRVCTRPCEHVAAFSTEELSAHGPNVAEIFIYIINI